MSKTFNLLKEIIDEAGLNIFLLLISLNAISTILEFFSLSTAIGILFNSSYSEVITNSNLDISKKVLTLIVLLFMRGIIRLIVSILKESIRSEFKDSLRQSLLKDTIFGSFDKLKNINRAEILGSLINNINGAIISLDQSIASLNGLLSFFIYFLVLNIFTKNSLIIIFFASIATLLAAIFQRSKSTELGNLESKLNIDLQRTLGDSLHGLKGIKAASAENWIMERFTNDNTEYRSILRQNIKRQGIFDLFRDLFILIIIGIWLFNSNNKDYKTIAATIVFGLKCTNSLSLIISSYRRVKLALPGYEKYKKIKRQLQSDDIILENIFFRKSPLIKKFTWFSSEKNKEISLNSGEILIIRGDSGSGKTTLIDSLLGFNNPQSSKWNLINKNNKLIFKGIRDSNKLKNLIAYAPQKGILYEGSLRENITMQTDNYNDLEYLNRNDVLINKWFSQLNLLHLLVKNKGLNQRVNLTTDFLSGGEIQRICLIRAWFKNKNIEILDEPTVYLDEDSVSIVKRIIKERSKNKITIIATHDSKLVDLATKVIDLNNID